MTTFVPVSTYLLSIHPFNSDKFKTHKCCGLILSKPNSFDSFSTKKGLNMEVFRGRGSNYELVWKRIKKRVVLDNFNQGFVFTNKQGLNCGGFRERGSSLELGKGKDEILFNGLKRMKKRVVLANFNQGFVFTDKKGLNFGEFRERGTNLELGKGKDGILFNGSKRMKKRASLVRFSLGFNGGGGGGGGGGRDDSNTARILGNLALAVGLTYLTLTDQLGWILDAIVSVWLLAIVLPIVGLGAFLWWAGRDIVQSSCPNCGNEFQIFRSVINDDSLLCPYCSQPFSVVGDKFVRDPLKSQANTFGEAFNDFFPHSKKEREFSKAIVDIEAEVKDVE